MRLAILSFPLLTLALAGCQGVALAPDLKTQPHATLASSHVDVDNDRTDVFRVLEIDGRAMIDPTDMTAKNVEVDHSALLAAGRGTHVAIDALAYYNNTARRLFWDPMHVKGAIDFVPVDGASYVLRGSLTSEQYSVWIENAATHEVVGTKISAPGRASAAAGAASAPPPQMRSGGA